jgi:hypothetical protein
MQMIACSLHNYSNIRIKFPVIPLYTDWKSIIIKTSWMRIGYNDDKNVWCQILKGECEQN